MNQHIKTELGTVVIVIFAITAFTFVWIIQKNQSDEVPIETAKVNQVKKQEVVVQPTGETAGWQTYRNEKYGFEFQYPKGSTPFLEIGQKNEVIPATTTSKKVIIVRDEKLLLCCETTGVTVLTLDKSINPQEWLNNHQREYFSESQQVAKISKEIIFNSKKAFALTGEENIGSKYRVIALETNNSILVIIQDVNDAFSDQILSTFKFTK